LCFPNLGSQKLWGPIAAHHPLAFLRATARECLQQCRQCTENAERAGLQIMSLSESLFREASRGLTARLGAHLDVAGSITQYYSAGRLVSWTSLFRPVSGRGNVDAALGPKTMASRRNEGSGGYRRSSHQALALCPSTSPCTCWRVRSTASTEHYHAGISREPCSAALRRGDVTSITSIAPTAMPRVP
jgi:hypothetical protein